MRNELKVTFSGMVHYVDGGVASLRHLRVALASVTYSHGYQHFTLPAHCGYSRGLTMRSTLAGRLNQSPISQPRPLRKCIFCYSLCSTWKRKRSVMKSNVVRTTRRKVILTLHLQCKRHINYRAHFTVG